MTTDTTHRPPADRAWGRRTALLVGALTLLAFVLRLVGLHESLFGDEIRTYALVSPGHSLGDVVDTVRDTTGAPPLHPVLAWLAVQVGEPDVWIRVPSLVAGTASVPLTYLLGERTVGRPAALVGAALLAISPFAIWDGEDARPYALLMVFVVAGAYCLVRARDAEGRAWPWWLAYALASGLALYTHETAMLVIVVEFGWAVWSFARRDRLAEPFIAVGGAIVLYVPWIPTYLDHHRAAATSAVDAFGALTASTAFRYPAQALFGHPFSDSWSSLLGPVGVGLLLVALAAVVVGCATGWPGMRERIAAQAEGAMLLVLMALAVPIGLLLAAAVTTNVYAPRNLSASVPAALLLLGTLAMWPAQRPRAVAAACLVGAVAIACVNGLAVTEQRAPIQAVAAAIDRLAKPGDPVVVERQDGDALQQDEAAGYAVYLERPHELMRALDPDSTAFQRTEDTAARAPAWVLVVPAKPGEAAHGPDGVDLTRFRVVSHHVYEGATKVSLFVLQPR
jgi:4-amino-4-deoxy-L-arabinose transferase-like glycosyltransferase